MIRHTDRSSPRLWPVCHHERVTDPRLPRDPETGGLLFAHVVHDPALLMAALEEFGDRESARIGYTHMVLDDGTEVEVSTVDLVWSAPGGAFETMVFVADRGSRYVRRYTTREAAEIGHAEVAAGVAAGLLDDRLFVSADVDAGD